MLCFRSKTHILTLYFLDSGSYSSGVLDLWGLFHGSEYDWIHQDQINWFLQESGMRFKFRDFHFDRDPHVRINRPHRTTLYAGRG